MNLTELQDRYRDPNQGQKGHDSRDLQAVTHVVPQSKEPTNSPCSRPVMAVRANDINGVSVERIVLCSLFDFHFVGKEPHLVGKPNGGNGGPAARSV